MHDLKRCNIIVSVVLLFNYFCGQAVVRHGPGLSKALVRLSPNLSLSAPCRLEDELKFESEPGRRAPARGSIWDGMARSGPSYDPVTKFLPRRWVNVWQQRNRVFYRSKLCPRAISATTLPLLRKELMAMGIALKSIRAYLDHHNVKVQAKRAAAKPC